jgi:RimJ/RimL family protein N-acetyltransferase
MNFPFDKEIVLENERVLLMPLQLSDLGKLLKVATEDEALLQYSPRQIYSEELLKENIRIMFLEKSARSRYPFIIFDKTQNAWAGSTSFLNISNMDSRLEIGSTWIGREFQKTGLNRNCKYLLLQYCFEEIGVERVEFKTDERNAISRQAIEGIGAQFEGILRSHTLMSDGFRRNTVCYSILRDEWGTVKQNFPIH